MGTAITVLDHSRDALSPVRALAQQAFARAAGAPLVERNGIRLLKDAQENYPAWLDAIRAAKCYVHFENYIIHEDAVGLVFANALIAKAQQGVLVRLIYDWVGCLGKASRGFWRRLRAGGVEVRCFNPLRWDSPLGWVSRDHRKTLSVDGEVAFVTGLCVGQMWVGVPEKKIEPWRDTGVEVRGPSVKYIEEAFAVIWATAGTPILHSEPTGGDVLAKAGDTALRIVASEPVTAGLLRINELVAALATSRLWLTDAYFAGTTAYVQALCAAAKDGVDVRLLVPNATDIPLLKPLSRSGYRSLLGAGVRVFEWNGPMIHAKTAVADTRWARVGSTNLNIASWFGNYEMDVIVEDESFARLMEQTYLQDLDNATEIILDVRSKLRTPDQAPPRRVLNGAGGSVGRAAAGAVRVGNAVGAAFTNRRVLGPAEARLTVTGGVIFSALSMLFAFFPRMLAYPLGFAFAWIAISLFHKGYKLHRARSWRGEPPDRQAPSGGR